MWLKDTSGRRAAWLFIIGYSAPIVDVFVDQTLTRFFGIVLPGASLYYVLAFSIAAMAFGAIAAPVKWSVRPLIALAAFAGLGIEILVLGMIAFAMSRFEGIQ